MNLAEAEAFARERGLQLAGWIFTDSPGRALAILWLDQAPQQGRDNLTKALDGPRELLNAVTAALAALAIGDSDHAAEILMKAAAEVTGATYGLVRRIDPEAAPPGKNHYCLRGQHEWACGTPTCKWPRNQNCPQHRTSTGNGGKP